MGVRAVCVCAGACSFLLIVLLLIVLVCVCVCGCVRACVCVNTSIIRSMACIILKISNEVLFFFQIPFFLVLDSLYSIILF